MTDGPDPSDVIGDQAQAEQDAFDADMGEVVDLLARALSAAPGSDMFRDDAPFLICVEHNTPMARDMAVQLHRHSLTIAHVMALDPEENE